MSSSRHTASSAYIMMQVKVKVKVKALASANSSEEFEKALR